MNLSKKKVFTWLPIEWMQQSGFCASQAGLYG
jgi:hypothetical protein